MGVNWTQEQLDHHNAKMDHPRDQGLKFARKVDKPKSKVKCDPESFIQGQAECYLQAKNIDYIHIPDELYKFLFSGYLSDALKRDFKLYGWLQRIRTVVSDSFLGLPDLIMFRPRGKSNDMLGLELKTKIGTTTKSQKKWLKKLNGHVCRDFTEVTKIVEEWENEK